MTDLINRADAIEAIMKHHDGELNQINYGLTLAKNEIQALPSAEIPTKSTNTPTNTPTDLISREDAIEAVVRLRGNHCRNHTSAEQE